MYTLAFDTTARSCSIALFKGDKIVSSFNEEMDFGQGETLIPEIEKMLKKHSIIFKNIGLVIVCTGPGSFTGVRASISAARAFGLVNEKLKIMGVTAFDAYAHDLGFDERADFNAVIIETKRDDFYFQMFDKNLSKIGEAQALSREEIVANLRKKEVCLTGDGVERFLGAPTGLVFKTIKMPSSLQIESLGRCGLKKFENKVIDFPKPLYLRAPDICVKQG